jgi:hypothetical protein
VSKEKELKRRPWNKGKEMMKCGRWAIFRDW